MGWAVWTQTTQPLAWSRREPAELNRLSGVVRLGPRKGTGGMADESQGGADAVQNALAEAQASLKEMQATVDGAESPSDEPPVMELPDFAGAGQDERSVDLLGDVDLDVSIELGRTEMLVEDVLKLQSGSVVELDKLAGDPVDVHVNGRLVARGEVLVLNDNFCIRVSEIVADLEDQAKAAERLLTQGSGGDPEAV